jgi:hypothetical protein
VDPFYTELARLRQGAVALREQLDALGDDEASAVQRAELEPLVDKLERIDAQIAVLSARHDLTAACATDAAARAACEFCVEISKLQAAQLTPQIYDGFENDPNKALLLLMHNTNLRSCPALDRLRQMTRGAVGVSCCLRKRTCCVQGAGVRGCQFHSICSAIATSRLL